MSERNRAQPDPRKLHTATKMPPHDKKHTA